MSSTGMLTNNANTVKLWGKKAWVQAMQRSVVGHAFGRGSIYVPPELQGRDVAGDQITFSYVGKLTGIPLGEGSVADGNEEALDLKAHNMVMNVSRIPVLNPNKDTIEQQRTFIDFESHTLKLISNRAVELMDTSFFYQAAGANPTSFTINGTTYANAADKLQVQGHNTPVAPTSERIVRAAAAATDQALTSSDRMTLDLVDYALELNDRSDQPIERLDNNTFDLFVSPEQLVDLQQDASGKIQWFNIELAKLTGGMDSYIENSFNNKMICAGRYRDVNIYSAPRVAFGVNGSTSAVITNVRRAVLLGKDALSFASPFGGRVTDKDAPIKIFTMEKDYGYYKGVEGRLIYGLKKMTPASKQDIGSMVISTWAAAHA
jgi:hypothetical protein